jgi:hypothetical protein
MFCTTTNFYKSATCWRIFWKTYDNIFQPDHIAWFDGYKLIVTGYKQKFMAINYKYVYYYWYICIYLIYSWAINETLKSKEVAMAYLMALSWKLPGENAEKQKKKKKMS